jgi:hypothetical protein
MSKEFMQAIYETKMNTHDFVYILPWLQSGSKDVSPWLAGSKNEMMQKIKNHYANAIIVCRNSPDTELALFNFIKFLHKNSTFFSNNIIE